MSMAALFQDLARRTTGQVVARGVGDVADRRRTGSVVRRRRPRRRAVRTAPARRRRLPAGAVLPRLVLSRVGANAASHEPLTDQDDWFAALADVFDLRFDHSPPGACDRLWSGAVDRPQLIR